MFPSVFSVQSGVSAQEAVFSCILLQESFLVCLLLGESFFSPHIVYKLRDVAADSFGNITYTASGGLTCVSDFLALCILGIEPKLFPCSYLSLFKILLGKKRCNCLRIVLQISRDCRFCIAVVVCVTDV